MRALSPALLALAATLAPAGATAGSGPGGNVPATGSLFATALAGQNGFDSRRGVTDDLEGSFGIAFRFTDRLSGELSGSRTETHIDTVNGAPVDADTTRADALWHYYRSGKWQPYVSSGAGQLRFNVVGSESSETFASFGVGVFRHLAGPFHFRADARTLYSLDEEAWDYRLAAGITVAFGGNYQGPAPEAAPATP